MATITRAVTLKHRASLGEDVHDVAFAAGDAVTLLREWSDRYLVRDQAGRVFNVPKDLVDPAD